MPDRLLRRSLLRGLLRPSPCPSGGAWGHLKQKDADHYLTVTLDAAAVLDHSPQGTVGLSGSGPHPALGGRRVVMCFAV